MKKYLLLLLVMVTGQSYAAGDCKLKWRDGTDVDSSTYTTYTGECKNGYADGKGVYRWSDGGYRYEGDFKSGQYNGIGVRNMWLNSDRYERYVGAWQNGRKNGFGRLYIASGEFDLGNFDKEGLFVDGKLVKECPRTECDPDYDAYSDLDQKTKEDILMSKITTAIKEERYKDALVHFSFLERYNNKLPESFYFYQIQSLSKANFLDTAKDKAKDYLKKYGSKGKYYAEVVEIMGR